MKKKYFILLILVICCGCFYLIGSNNVSNNSITVEKKEYTASNDAADLEIKNLSSTGFDIYVQLKQNIDVVQKVMIPTWTAKNGQDDIIWYPTENLGGGRFHCRVDLKDHKNEFDAYISHVYAFNNINDPVTNAKKVIETTTNVTGLQVEVTNISPDGYDVSVYAPIVTGLVDVKFPTWTTKDWQDDLVWHVGENVEDNKWHFRINTSDHKNESGTYVTDIYAIGQANVLTKVAEISVEVPKKPIMNNVLAIIAIVISIIALVVLGYFIYLHKNSKKDESNKDNNMNNDMTERKTFFQENNCLE